MGNLSTQPDSANIGNTVSMTQEGTVAGTPKAHPSHDQLAGCFFCWLSHPSRFQVAQARVCARIIGGGGESFIKDLQKQASTPTCGTATSTRRGSRWIILSCGWSRENKKQDAIEQHTLVRVKRRQRYLQYHTSHLTRHNGPKTIGLPTTGSSLSRLAFAFSLPPPV